MMQTPHKDRSPFRTAVLKKLENEPGFVTHSYSRHLAKQSVYVLLNEKYAQEINRSKIFFTCGSRSDTGGIPVLKFFEAPGCNTLLLVEKSEDLAGLGFVDRENFVACTVENVHQKATYYLENELERNEITTNGYQLIHQHHTNQIRAQQLIDSINSQLEN